MENAIKRLEQIEEGASVKIPIPPYPLDITGAEGETRTLTGLPPLDFESSASTNSTTSAL